MELIKNEVNCLIENYAHVYYIDSWKMDSLTEDDFQNGDHVNVLETIKVTKKIEEEMEKLID